MKAPKPSSGAGTPAQGGHTVIDHLSPFYSHEHRRWSVDLVDDFLRTWNNFWQPPKKGRTGWICQYLQYTVCMYIIVYICIYICIYNKVGSDYFSILYLISMLKTVTIAGISPSETGWSLQEVTSWLADYATVSCQGKYAESPSSNDRIRQVEIDFTTSLDILFLVLYGFVWLTLIVHNSAQPFLTIDASNLCTNHS